MGSISVEQVTFAYDDALGGAASVRSGSMQGAPAVLDRLSLHIPNGQFLCVIGPSGAGKTTLLRLLLGLDEPSAGRLVIDGKPVDGPGLDRSFVFQNYSLFPWMKVQENVEFGIEQASKELGRGLEKAERVRIARDYLGRVKMLDAADKYPYQLSGGMQQRVAIARALAMDTQILIFDEPFGALDVKTRRVLQGLVEELWSSGGERKTVVFVTHDIPEALLLADRIVYLSKGGILADVMVDLPRPRSVEALSGDARAQGLERQLTELFYRDPAAEADIDGVDADGAGVVGAAFAGQDGQG